MRRLKLLFAAAALMLGVGSASAQQTDVTSTYLTNADFSVGTPIGNGICTYGKDMAGNNTEYYGAQEVSGWTNASVGASGDGYEGNGLAGGIFAYSGTPFLGGSGYTAPADAPEGSTGNTLGLMAVWGNKIQYTKDVTLPAGSYTLRFKVYNATSGSGNSSGIITTNLFGFVPNEGTAYYAPNKTFAIGQWSTVAVTFKLTAETAGKISMGYVGPGGGAAMPHLFVDNVKILKNTYYEDVTSKVNKTSWTGASDGYQGGAINTARQYGDKSIGRHIYQKVSGLKNGTYEVALYSISQKEWNGSLANDAGDVAYVFADNGENELKEWINARARNSYPGDDNLGIYTISGVEVTDGTLTIGMGLAKADLTEWHHVQIHSLIYTKNLDLSGFVTAYQDALAAAKVTAAKTDKMATSLKTTLNNAIDTYDEGKVSLEDADAMEAATDALKTATAKAETSIASYAIIATGSIPDNSLEGWTCTNTNTFHINTWSAEGNSDGSNMKTPFIENWVSKGNYLGAGKVYYRLEGLEPGEVYYASALVRSYNEANSDAPNGPNFYINNVGTDLASDGTTFTFNGMSGIYATLGGAATIGDNGILELGVEIAENRNYNWVAFKNVSIQSMDDALNAAVAKVTVLEGTVPTSIYNNAYDVVTANTGDNKPTTAGGYETAIAAIEAAATTASAYVEPYAAWTAAKNNAETNYSSVAFVTTVKNAQSTIVEAADEISDVTSATTELNNAIAYYENWVALKKSADALVVVSTDDTEANTTLASAIIDQATAVEGATTAADITNATTKLKDAMVTYVTTAEPINDECFDLTFMIVNPHFTEGNADNPTGWTVNYPAAPEGQWGGNKELRASTHNFEAYHKQFTLSQTIPGLSKGTYKVTLQGFARHDGDDKNKTNLFCGIVNQPIKNISDEYSTTPLTSGKPAMGDNNGESSYIVGEETRYQPNGMSGSYYFFQEINPATNQPFYTSEVQTLMTDNGDLTIGFKCETWSDWVIWDNFHLYYYGSAIAVTIDENKAGSVYEHDIENANVTLNRTFNADKWNTIALPFDLSDAETKAAFGNGAQVATFSESLTNNNLDSKVTFTIAADASITANTPVLLKTSTTETIFKFNGKTIKAGEAKAEGDYYFDFVGTYAASTTIAEGDYFIGDNQLWKSEGATTIKGTRAYFKAKDPENGARIANFCIGDSGTTGIVTIDNGVKSIDNAMFDLQGRKVENVKKGLYIKNSKKVVVR